MKQLLRPTRSKIIIYLINIILFWLVYPYLAPIACDVESSGYPYLNIGGHPLTGPLWIFKFIISYCPIPDYLPIIYLIARIIMIILVFIVFYIASGYIAELLRGRYSNKVKNRK